MAPVRSSRSVSNSSIRLPELFRFLFGAMIDRPHTVALAQQPVQPPFRIGRRRQRLVRIVFRNPQKPLRAAVEALAAAIGNLRRRLFRLVDQAFGEAAAFAGLRQRLFRFAQLPVDAGQRRLGFGQRRRRRRPAQLALGDQGVGGGLAGGEIVGCAVDPLRFDGNLAMAFLQRRYLGVAALDAPTPSCRVFAGGGPAPRASRRFGFQPVAGLLLAGEILPQGGKPFAHVGELRLRGAVFRDGVERGARFDEGAGDVPPFAFQRCQRFGDRFPPAAPRNHGLLERGQRGAARVEQIERFANRGVGAAQGFGSGLRLRPGSVQIGACRGNLFFDGENLAADSVEPVLLRQTLRRCGRRAGGGDKPVPPHHAAVARHRALPLGKQRRNRFEQIGIVDNGDLVEPARQSGGRFDEPAQRSGGARQIRAFPIGVRAGVGAGLPADRRRLADRGIEIVAERSAERGLVAGGHPDIFDHRPCIAGGPALQQGFQRIRLGTQAGQRFVVGLQDAARLLDRFRRIVALGFGPVRRRPDPGNILFGSIRHPLRGRKAGPRFVGAPAHRARFRR